MRVQNQSRGRKYMSINADKFKKALQLWTSGVTVVCTQSATYGIQGMTVSAFSSVSVEPPQILVCLNDSADTCLGLFESHCFAVNVLSSEQQETSVQFAGACSQQQRFENAGWTAGVTGAPILTASLMSLDCSVVERFRAGTHWIIIGEVQDSICRTGEPLLYYRGDYRQLLEH
jgi:flavin reductase (DIM6/NTAB) family NADH-FMN oxidoreductase RutF